MADKELAEVQEVVQLGIKPIEEERKETIQLLAVTFTFTHLEFGIMSVT